MVEDFPFENMVGTYRLYPVTERQATYIAWTTTFDVKGDASAGAFTTLLENDVYGNCLRGLRHLAAA